MPNTTTNIGLQKPLDDEFADIQIVNGNMDIIDVKLGPMSSIPTMAKNVAGAITELHDELKDSVQQPVVLQQGVHIYSALRDSQLKGISMSGRTLINILGNDGGMESLTPFTQFGSGISLSAVQKRSGINSFKSVPNGGAPSYIHKAYDYKLETTKNYVVVAWAFVESHTSGGGSHSVSLYDKGTISNARYSATIDSSKVGQWQLIYVKIPLANTLVGSGFTLFVGSGNSGVNAVYYDEVRIYEVSAADYAAIGTTVTGAAIDKLFPYVDNVKHVNGVWMENKGKNLLGVFSEWELPISPAQTIINNPYKMTITSTADYQQAMFYFIAIKGQTYTLNVSNPNAGEIKFAYYDKMGVFLGTANSFGSVLTFTIPQNAERVAVGLGSGNKGAGTFVFTNPMLNVGDTAIPFEPQKSSYLYIPNPQLKSNVDGSVRDELTTDGQGNPVVTRRFREMVLDGSAIDGFNADFAGFKQITIKSSIVKPSMGVVDKAVVVKYDGKVLSTTSANPTAADQINWNASYFDSLFISVADIDSGWGESYTPTVDEIKAYFNGWRMMSSDNGQNPLYNGTGTKMWREGWGGGSMAYTTVPTRTAYPAYKPYRLIYQLAASVTESVQHEGKLMLESGANQIEVGTGLILREASKPKNGGTGYYAINTTEVAYAGSSLNYRSEKLVGVYKNGERDLVWGLAAGFMPHGREMATTSQANFDPTAAYSTTYLALDTHTLGIAPLQIKAEYAPNMRESVESLVREVVEARTEVSVLRNTKDNSQMAPPVWIRGTLINGWLGDIHYTKDKNDIVTVRFGLTVGTTTLNAVIMHMPAGYLPGTNMPLPTTNNNTGTAGTGLYVNNSLGGIAVTGSTHFTTGHLIYGMHMYKAFT